MDLPSIAEIVTRHPPLRVCTGSRGMGLSSILRTVIWWSILPVLVFLGSFLDGTLYMTRGSRGLLQHYGFWAWVLTSPIITILAAWALSKFVSIMQRIEAYSTINPAPPELDQIIRKHVSSLSLRENTRFIYFLFIIAGLLFGVLNIRQTLNPALVYGNGVYDSPPYWRGFLLTKLYLVGLWTLIYPTVLFVSFHLTFSLIWILHHMCRRELLRLDFFHRDNCGGLSVFGAVNTLIMLIYACIFVVIVALHETHRHTYGTLLLSSITTFAVFTLQSFGAVFYIHKFTALRRNQELDIINRRLSREATSAISNGGHMSLDLFSFRAHLLSLNTYPYSKATLAIVNIIRFAPAAIAIGKFFP